jgi:hypothetical protein
VSTLLSDVYCVVLSFVTYSVKCPTFRNRKKSPTRLVNQHAKRKYTSCVKCKMKSVEALTLIDYRPETQSSRFIEQFLLLCTLREQVAFQRPIMFGCYLLKEYATRVSTRSKNKSSAFGIKNCISATIKKRFAVHVLINLVPVYFLSLANPVKTINLEMTFLKRPDANIAF